MCTNYQHMLCEHGVEDVAHEIVGHLPHLKRIVEEKQLPFVRDVNIYVYKNIDTFVKRSGATSNVRAAVTNDAIHVSPTINSFHEFGSYEDLLIKTMTHELSHLNLLQNFGHNNYQHIPSWFLEGLATYVSNGGGVESVSGYQAKKMLIEGMGFSPEKEGDFQEKIKALKINPQIYYKQAEGFVRFIYSMGHEKFDKFLKSLITDGGFNQLFIANYKVSVGEMWRYYFNVISREY